MALDWLTVLKTVPWGNVIENAPKVAQGARALWQRVGGERAAPDATSAPQPSDQPQADVAVLAERLAAQQRQIDTLRDNLAQASALIDALAEQQGVLTQQLQQQRRWVRLLAVGVVLALGLALAAWLHA